MFVTPSQKYYFPIVSQKHLAVYPYALLSRCAHFPTFLVFYKSFSEMWLMCLSNHLCPTLVLSSSSLKRAFWSVFFQKMICPFVHIFVHNYKVIRTNTKLVLSLLVICRIQCIGNLHRKSKRHLFIDLHWFFIRCQSPITYPTI